VRHGIAVASVIVSWSPGDVVQEVAASRSSVALLVVKLMTTIPSSGVVVFVGLAGLGSQDHSHEPHPTGRIWTAVHRTYRHRLAVLSCLRGVTQG
jgi:hypothetical protein